MKYYDKLTHTETHTESATTVASADNRVKDFFKPLADGYRLIIVNDLPIIELIPLPTQEEIVTKQTNEANALVYQELEKLDRESIRVIREWIATQATAPQILKDKEVKAIIERSKIQ